MKRIFEREHTFADIIFRPLERLLYRVAGIDESYEMRWTEYSIAMLAFGLITLVLTYVIERVQHLLRKRVVWAVLMGGCQSYVST